MAKENQATRESREQIRRYMIDELHAPRMGWEIPGPPDTDVAFIQCWGIQCPITKATRLVIVEGFGARGRHPGFEVFPQILPHSRKGTTRVINQLSDIEQRIQRGA